MKIQAKDCPQGGLFQMEPEPGTSYQHQLAPGFQYCIDQLDRVLLTNGVFFVRANPQLAKLLEIDPDTSRWSVADGGRVGMVVGETPSSR